MELLHCPEGDGTKGDVCCCGPTVEDIFKVLCDCSALNPDSDAEEEGEGEFFFDEDEVLAGLSEEERARLLAERTQQALAVADEVDEVIGVRLGVYTRCT